MFFNATEPRRRQAQQPQAVLCHPAAGFTLLEVLVVLLVVGLLVASLLEGLYRFNDARSRFGAGLRNLEMEGLANFWFRESINAAWPDEKGGAHVFIGSATAFSGLTLEPLGGDPGAPTGFRWELVYNSLRDRTTLVYTGADGRPLELRWWPGSKVGFSYLGPDLTWHENWPMDAPRAKQLPRAVRLFVGADRSTVVAAVEGETESAAGAKGLTGASR